MSVSRRLRVLGVTTALAAAPARAHRPLLHRRRESRVQPDRGGRRRSARGPLEGHRRRAARRELLRLLRRLGQAGRDLPLADPGHQHQRVRRLRRSSHGERPHRDHLHRRRQRRERERQRQAGRVVARPHRRRRQPQPGPGEQGRHARPAPDGRVARHLLASHGRRRQRVEDPHQPRSEGDPARRALRHRALRRPPVPGGAGRLHRPRLPGHPRAHARHGHQRPRVPGLDVQPLPGDVARAALPPRHRAVRRRRARALGRPARPASTSRPARSRATPAPAARRTPTARSRPSARRSTPTGSSTASTSCPATPRSTAPTPAVRRSPARAASTPAAAAPASWSATPR